MKPFNIILSGVGGQGLITLVTILDQACLNEGYDVRSSELHGLSQRGGSVQAHVRFGKKVYSPLISNKKTDIIIDLETSEALKSIMYANEKTKILVNDNSVPYLGGLPKKELLETLKKTAKNNLYLVSASKICEEKLQKEVVSGMYILGYACYKKLIPLTIESLLKATEQVIPTKYLESNKKAVELAKL